MTLSRKTPMRRGGRIKAKKRKPSEFARIYGSKARVAWIKSSACIVCNSLSPSIGEATKGSCHNAHTETGGTGRKANYDTIVPLCSSHHRRYDQHEFPLDNAVTRKVIQTYASVIQQAWLAHLAGGLPERTR